MHLRTAAVVVAVLVAWAACSTAVPAPPIPGRPAFPPGSFGGGHINNNNNNNNNRGGGGGGMGAGNPPTHVFNYRHSFRPPFFSGAVPFWELHGALVEDKSVRLTAAERS